MFASNRWSFHCVIFFFLFVIVSLSVMNLVSMVSVCCGLTCYQSLPPFVLICFTI